MDAREQRGALIAATQKLTKKGQIWLVPSQSDSGKKYTVSPDPLEPHCSCPDCEAGFVCKHIHAVRFTLTRITQEEHLDGTTITTTETLTVETTTAKRKTYKQDWPKYDAGQMNEHRHFSDLLADLCSMLPETPRKPGCGRKPVSYRDGLFAAVLKVYSLMSARRFNGELEEAYEKGYISKMPHFTSVLNVFDKPEVTPLLKSMIETSALPLKAVETKFAVDSTGFATTTYGRWYDHKYGVERTEARWVKAHFATGVRTNVVTAVNIEHQDAADSPQFAGLVHKTAENFKVDEVSADKAYPSVANFEAVEAHGGKFFPMFKSNATGACGGAYEKAFHMFSLRREEYDKRYHLRSNVESTVSAIKRKMGHAVKAKNDLAQKNEAYAKFVAYNITVLIAEMYQMDIDPSFGNNRGQEERPATLRFV